MKRVGLFFCVVMMALALRADIPGFWLDAPTGRNNPHDPKSPQFNPLPLAPVATATLPGTRTITPTPSATPTASITRTSTPTRTPTPLSGSPVNITVKDYRGTPVPNAWVMAENDPARVAQTNASGQCTINVVSTTYKMSVFAPPDGTGAPTLIPHILTADQITGSSVSFSGVFRPPSPAVPGDLVLSAATGIMLPNSYLLVTWLPANDEYLGLSTMVPVTSLPTVVAKLRRPGAGTAMVASMDAAGNTLGVAWVSLTYTAATVSFSASLGLGFTVTSRSYSAVSIDPHLQDFRHIMQAGTFSSTRGVFDPPPGTANSSSFVASDILPVPATYNDDPRFAAWGTSGSDHYFSWNLFQAGTYSASNPSFYLQQTPDILSDPGSGAASCQTRENYGWGWGWAIISKQDPADPWPRFFPEDEVLRMMSKDSDSSSLRTWDFNIAFPAALSPTQYGMQPGQAYKFCIGETYTPSSSYASSLNGGLPYVTRMSAASRLFTR